MTSDDPKGTPHRRTRQKARYLLGLSAPGERRQALELLIERRPDVALDVLADAMAGDS